MFLSNYLFPPKFNSYKSKELHLKRQINKILQSDDYIKAFLWTRNAPQYLSSFMEALHIMTEK